MSFSPLRIPLLLILYLSFVSLGLPDSALGVAWPRMRLSFGMSTEAAGLLLTMTTIFSVISSIFSGAAGKRLGTGPLVAACAGLTAAAMFGYALSPAWSFILACTVLFGIGQGAVDTAINAHMARNYSARHMNWVHCCWGAGATGGPLILAAAFGLGSSWRGGYLALGCVQTLLAAFFFLTLRVWKADANGGDAAATIQESAGANKAGASLKPKLPARAALAVGAGTLFYFLYPGIELVAGLWGASYLIERAGAGAAVAGACIAAYWASLTAGRFITGIVASRFSDVAIIRTGLGIGACGALLLWSGPGFGLSASVSGLILLGLGISPLYPTMMHDTPRRVGKLRSETAIGMQVGAALAGAATIPALLGLLAASRSLSILGPVLLSFIALTFLMHELSAAAARESGCLHQT